MILERSLKIRNYKCFGDDEQGFEKILPINIIIGKNNSGKSSLIDLIEYLVSPQRNLIIDYTKTSHCLIGLTITEEVLTEVGTAHANVRQSTPETWIRSVHNHAGICKR